MEAALIAIDGQAKRDGEVGLNLTRAFNINIIIILVICYYANDGHEERSGCGCGGRDKPSGRRETYNNIKVQY